MPRTKPKRPDPEAAAVSAAWKKITAAGAVTSTPRSADAIARAAGLGPVSQSVRDVVLSALNRPDVRRVTERSSYDRLVTFFVLEDKR
jgi:hypothetical protein